MSGWLAGAAADRLRNELLGEALDAAARVLGVKQRARARET